MVKKTKIIFIIVFTSFTLLVNTKAQDGLYLVGTTTGMSEQEKINSAKGAGDVNGDGFADFIITFSNHTNLYYGSTGFDTIPDYTFQSAFVYPIGDINNDGYCDLLAGESDTSFHSAIPVFRVYCGGKELDTIPKLNYSPPYLWDMVFSSNIEDIGDLNGDGYRDFVIASPYNWDDGKGRVYIFHGGEELEDKPARIIISDKIVMGNFFGNSVVGHGDNNNDGYDDILVAQMPIDGDSGNVQLFYGGNIIDSIPDKIIMPNDRFFGNVMRNLGDINSDAHDEFIITSYSKSYIFINMDSILIMNNKNPGINGTVNIGTGGDINGDGIPDFLISDTLIRGTNNEITNIVHGYYGNTIVDTVEDLEIQGEQPYSSFGCGVSTNNIQIVGDVNKDGYDDVVINAPTYRVDSQQVGKIYIYSFTKINNVKEINSDVNSYSLTPNYPNPFNPETYFDFNIPATSQVSISIFNILGEKIVPVIDEERLAGAYKFKLSFDKYNLSSGIYFIEMIATNRKEESFRRVIKAVLLK